MAGEKTNICLKSKDRILLVDDDEAFLKVGQAILRARGYDVDTAYNGREALRKLEETVFSLVVLDILLPDMSGIELLTSINRVQPDIISIISTGYSSIENSVQSLNLGAFAYLEKPLHPERLLDVIRRGLEKRNLQQENRRLLRELEQRNRDLNILLSVSQSVSCSLNPEQIVDSALDIIDNSLGIDAGYLFFQKGEALMLKGCQGINEDFINRIHDLRLTGSVINQATEKNEPLYFERMSPGTDILMDFLVKNGYSSLLLVPVATTKQVEGTMAIATRSGRMFSPLEVNLLKAIGREIAIAITNTRLFEEASSARALRELDSLRTELLANVSHELRTPLAAIKGFASSLLQPDISFDDETRLSFIRTIDGEADRLSHMIDDLLLMSRIEAGVFKANKEVFEIREIIDSIKDRLYSIAIKHNLRIIIPDNLPPVVVDGPRIGEVFTNLVENAVKYSPEASEIRIEIELHDDQIVAHVRDNGIGIPEEYQPMVFDRFNQLRSKNGQRKGSGLGLCICRGIVESHGGKIWVKSQPGEGATFSFNFPINDPLFCN
ncbi:MAG: response regulator [Dehalococcoidales bacterium]|nr:response regulator [Dehalococcoidales bacterium]